MLQSEQMQRLEFGRPHPGERVIVGHGAVWRGVDRWMCEHGSACTKWLLGRIDSVENVLLPDGTRSSGVRRGAPGSDLWRFKDADGVWTYGTLHVTKDDVSLVISEQQPSAPRWTTGSLPHQINSSSNACEMAEDPEFADSLYASLGAGVWKMVGSGKEANLTWARAAEVVVSMRGLNEPYSDFFLSGSENHVFEDACDLLQSMGWRFEGPLEDVEERHAKAIKLLQTCEHRQPQDMPGWYIDWWTAHSETDPRPDARLNRAAMAGKVSLREFQSFWEMFDIEA